MRIIFFIILLSVINIAQSIEGIDSIRTKKIPQTNLSELRSELNYIFNDPNFSNAYWGVSIQSLKTGETIFKLNEDKLFKPASLVKLFTSSTALLLLGSDYRFETKFYTDGKISNGILFGNLFIVGGGDPTIQTGHEEQSPDNFIEWVDSLNKLGIYSIKGNVIAENKLFSEDDYGKGWLNEYESNWFAPPSGAFCLNNNSTELIIKPGKINQFAEIFFNPSVSDFEVFNNVITVKGNLKPSVTISRKGNNIIQLNGSISSKSDRIIFYIPSKNPTQFFVNTFYNVMIREGITITGYPIISDEHTEKYQLNELLPLFTHKSQPLSQIVSEINKNSNNFFSEQLLKTIGFELYGFGSTQNGITAMKELLQKMGINPANFEIADGSGLSTFNLVTPKQVTNLLYYMYKSDEFDSFYNSLAIAGFDGTLADRMKKTKAENNFRGKSGFLENVRGLAGYLKTADGEPIALTLIVNNFLVPSQLANYVQDKVCNILSNFNRK